MVVHRFEITICYVLSISLIVTKQTGTVAVNVRERRKKGKTRTKMKRKWKTKRRMSECCNVYVNVKSG